MTNYRRNGRGRGGNGRSNHHRARNDLGQPTGPNNTPLHGGNTNTNTNNNNGRNAAFRGGRGRAPRRGNGPAPRGGNGPAPRDSGSRRHQGNELVVRRDTTVARIPGPAKPKMVNPGHAEYRELRDAQGNLVTEDLVNRAPGGGQQNRLIVMDPEHSGGMVVKTNGQEDVTNAVSMVQAMSGVDTVIARITPVDLSEFRRRIPSRQVVSRSAALGHSTGRLEPRITERVYVREVEDDDDEEEVMCGNCRSDGHQLSECLMAGLDGVMHGCPLCNTLDHDADDCKELEAEGLEDKVLWLVRRRSRMPAFGTRASWFGLLKRYLQSNPTASPPSFFPWTTQFTMGMDPVADLERLQREFDSSGKRDLLPSDPATINWETACRTLASPGVHIHPSDPNTLRNAAPGRFAVDAQVQDVRETPQPLVPPAVISSTLGRVEIAVDPSDFVEEDEDAPAAGPSDMDIGHEVDS